MRSFVQSLTVCTFALILLTAPASSADKGKPIAMNDKAFVHPITRWLVLGPQKDALPLFHEEDRGRYGVEDLLKAERGPSPRLRPEAGADWAAASEPKGGVVSLSTQATNEGKGYASAWLASYLTVDRFQAFDVEILGTHPRRIWVDGAPIAIGGVSKDEKGAEAKGSVKLEQGTHVVMIETIYEPERGAPWTAGATLSVAKLNTSGAPVVDDATDAARTLTLDDVLDPPQITALSMSPDGAFVAASMTRIVEGSDDAESWVAVRATESGALVRTMRGGVSIAQVSWAPSGHKLSYAARDRRDGGKESSSLWLADLDTGDTVPVLERIENLAGYVWAPDGASIVYSVTSKPEPDKRGVKLKDTLLDREEGWRNKNFLYQVTLPVGGAQGGGTRRLTAGALATAAFDFSPDGKRLLLTRNVEDFSARPYSRQELWELDLTTLYGNKLHDSRWLTSAQYAPDGKRILILAGPSEFGDLGRNVEAGTTPNESDGQLYVLDPGTGDVQALSRTFDPSIQAAYWSRFDGNIYVKAGEKDGATLFRYDEAAKNFLKLDGGGEVVQEFAFAEKSAAAACTSSGPWSPETLWAVDRGGRAARKLDAPAAAFLATVRKGRVEAAVFRSKSGQAIDGRVYLPPGFDPAAAAKYPAIVYYYGGTSPVTSEFGGRYPKEWWAAHGYVVYVPEPVGATGYGQARSAVHVNDWGRIASEEILDGTRAFLAAYPAVNAKRVGCIGASYGGFMTMLLVTKTDMFAAAVSHAGISNIASYWGEGNWGYSYGALATADAFPWNRKDVYVDRSPLYSADKVKTPLLLTHGVSDTNVPVGESESFFTALKLVGAPVELLTIEGQDHHILDHAKRELWSRSIAAWFDKWLKDQPAWWDDLYPKTQLK